MMQKEFITDKFHGKPNNNSIIGSRFSNTPSSSSMSYIKSHYFLDEMSKVETTK